MKFGILATEGSWYFRDLERAATARGHRCERLEFERLVARIGESHSRIDVAVAASDRSVGSPVSAAEFDAVIVRTMPPGSLEQVIYRMDCLGRLECAGVAVVNSPRSLECAVDKYLTTARLHAAGLPVPETIVCEHEEDALAAFEQLGRDVVVKPLFGAEGRGIVRVSDPDLAHRTFRTLMRIDSVLYLQRFIDHEGCDVRILVLNGQVLGGMRRRSTHDFRTNVSRQAVAEAYSPTPQDIDFALRAADVTGTAIAGIDLLSDRRGNCYVIEVNAVPGWQAFQRVTGIDVAGELIQAIERQRPA